MKMSVIHATATSTLSVYQQLHDRAQGDMDTFFQMANELPGVRGGGVEKKGDVQDNNASIIPIPPRSDGWRPCFTFLGLITEGNTLFVLN